MDAGINITGGTITSLNGSAIYTGNVVNGNITIGKKDGDVKDNPIIKSALNSPTIRAKNSKLKFYDGCLYGPENSVILTSIIDMEEGKELQIEKQEDQYQKVTLDDPVDYVAKIEGVGNYLTLQEAIEECNREAGDTKTTIKLLKDINLGRTVNIYQGQNIILNVNGKNIYAYAEPTFLNNGNIEFVNNIEGMTEQEYTNIINNGTYYFENQNGKWISNNNEIENSVATSYTEIDLTELTGEYLLTVNAEISSEENDIGYAIITNNTTIPEYDNENRFINISGGIMAKDYTTTLEGGNKYYLHLGYKKNEVTDLLKDQFIINNISIRTKIDISGSIISQAPTILENKGIATIGKYTSFEFYSEGIHFYRSSSVFSYIYQNAIKNIGTLNIDGGYIYAAGSKIYNIKNCSNGILNIKGGIIDLQYCYQEDKDNAAIDNVDNAILNIEGGKMNIRERSGGGGRDERIYGILNRSTKTVNIQDYVICAAASSEVYAIDNGSNASMNIIKTNINNDEKQNFNSFDYLSGTYGVCGNGGNLSIKDSIIDGFETGIQEVVLIENTQLTNSKWAIRCGDWSDYDTKIKGTTIKNTKNCGIVIYMLTADIENSIIESEGTSISVSFEGTVNILENTICTGNYGINLSWSSTANIGKKDGNVNLEYPYIKGNSYGAYINSGTLNFYDGKIEGKTNNSIYGNVTDKEEGYYVVKTNNPENNTQTAILQEIPIVEIEGIGQYSNLSNLQTAINDLEDNQEYKINALTKLEISPTENAITIPEGKIVTLDLKGYNMITSNNNTIINNGTLNIIDSSTNKTSVITNSGKRTLIQNNGTMNIDSIKMTISGTGSSSEYKKVIINNNTMQLNNVNITGNASDYDDDDYINVIDNENEANITITGGNITVKNGRIYNNSTSDIIIENAVNNLYSTVNDNEGNIIINGTSNLYNYCGINNKNTGDILINNGTIGSGWNSYSVYNYGNIEVNGGNIGRISLNGGTLTVRNGTINSINTNNNSIANIQGGAIGSITAGGNSSINIQGGTINAGISGCSIGISNNATCNIGINDENEITNTPTIIGYIDSTGTINYYDGTIETSSSYIGIVKYLTSIREGYQISVDQNASGNNVMKLIREEDVVSVGGTGYKSIEEAIGYCDEEDYTITLLADIYQINTIQINKKIKLDLNGQQINTFTINQLFINNSTLEITDSSGAQTGKIKGYTTNYIKNTNELIISGGCYYYKNPIDNVKIIYNTGEGTIDLKGGKIHFDLTTFAKNNISQYGIYTDSTGNINIENIEFVAGGYRYDSPYNSYQYFIYSSNVDTENRNTINLQNGTLSRAGSEGYQYGIVDNRGTADINITGGTIPNNFSYSVYSYQENNIANLNIAGGTLNSTVYFRGAIANINNTTIPKLDVKATTNIGATANITELLTRGTTTIDGGTIGTLKNYSTTTIDGGTIGTLKNYSTTTINDGTITVLQTYNNTNTIINDGTYTSIYNGCESGNVAVLQFNGGTVLNTAGYGIKNGSAATLTIGQDDGTVDTTYPTIEGSSYGVENYGTFNFYDGVMIGHERAIYGSSINTPEDYEPVYLENDTKAILEIIPVVSKIITVDGINYLTLQSAINTAVNGTEPVILHENIILSSQITIPEGKTVTINLNGCSITYSDEDAAIVNNGNLIIVDDSEKQAGVQVICKIENTIGKAIQNNGTITLGTDDGTNDADSPKIIGGIEGSGTMTIYDGVVE